MSGIVWQVLVVAAGKILFLVPFINTDQPNHTAEIHGKWQLTFTRAKRILSATTQFLVHKF